MSRPTARAAARPVVIAAAVALAVPPVAAFAYVGRAVHPAVVTATLPGADTASSGPTQDGTGGGPTQDGGRRTAPFDQHRGRGDATSGTVVSSAPGVLLIDGEVPPSGGSGGGTSAGTGMVLSADGYALTNYHVVEGTSALKVTVPDTGRSYTATVVGADRTHDVALLRLEGATDLVPVRIDDEPVSLGQAVSAVGNGGGRDRLYRVTGTVQDLDDDITVSGDGASASHRLTGLIRSNAAVVPGYSGGPLFDAEGEVMGINTAASSGGAPEGFAIPIGQSLAIVDQIKSGATNGTVRVGPKPVLGVQVVSGGRAGTSQLPGRAGDSDAGAQVPGGSGAVVRGVTEGSAAATAGLAAGATITAVDGAPIGDADALQAAIAAHRVGDRIEVTWLDAAGERHTARAELGASPLN